jgi:acyl-CoA synthetase (AMP-forming)/AMP-acid ligase II
LLQDFSFLRALPEGPLEVIGAWSEDEKARLAAVPRAASSDFREAPVLGVFTSGTLSLSPRLVLYSRRNVHASLEGIYGLFAQNRIEHVFCYPQAFHTFGLTLGYVASHIYGWRLHTPKGRYQTSAHIERLDLQAEKVLTLGTPTHFFDWLATARKLGRSPTPSYSCIMGGAGVSRELWRRVRDELAIEAPSIGYGCTEAAPGITHLPPGAEPEQDDEVGFPLHSLHARSVAEEGVEISGPSLCIGIVQNGQLTSPERLLIRDRLEIGPRGSWTYRGRLDLLMNRGGAKYSLEAIEKAIFERLGLATVACGVRDTRLGEDLALAIQHGASASLTREQILTSTIDILRDVFALKFRPEHARFITDFPLNECSKLDRKSIWTMFDSERTIAQ